MLARRVHLVEIDFLRSGRHTTAVSLGPAIERAGAFDYHACVSRAGRRGEFEIYPHRLGQRLPVLRIPLSGVVDDVAIALQPILDRCYDAGLYRRRINYSKPPVPPLAPEQQAWADGVLKAHGELQ